MNVSPMASAMLSIAMSVAAQFLLKAGMTRVKADTGAGDTSLLHTLLAAFGNVHVMAGFALYGLGAVVWLSVLARFDVSKAYPLVGLGFMATAVVGALLGEQVGLMRGVGIALICAGVALVGRS
jgi:multidrug transporter EmrE-like cation transporter